MYGQLISKHKVNQHRDLIKKNLKLKTLLLPISNIGIITLLLCIWSYFSIAKKSEDLIISVLALSIISIIALLCILNIFFYLKLKNKIDLNLILSDTVSKTKNKIQLAIKGCNIPSFFNLKISPKISSSSELILTGSSKNTSNNTRHSSFNVTFPHRGYWQFKGYKLEVGDILGISGKTWDIFDDKKIKVLPKAVQIQQIPMIAASASSGDEMNLPKERSGEPFDIKPYEKSDGVRRILWKTYARTKELYVRRPELAVIPEGEVAIFLIAKKEDDNVASAALRQIEYLNQQDLVVCFGADGSEKISYKYEEIEDEILKSAFSPNAGKAETILKFIKNLEEQNYSISQINVFCAEDEKIIEFLSTVENIRINLVVIKDHTNPAIKINNSLSHNIDLNVVNAY